MTQEFNQVQRWIQKARASWWEDGLAEIMSGLGLIVVGVLGFVKESTNQSPGGFWDFIYLGVLLAVSLGTPHLVRNLKRRWIWPKTGYAEPQGRKWDLKAFFWFLGLFLILGVLVLWRPSRLSGVLEGLFFFLILYSIARFSGLRRFLYIGLLSLLLGAALGFSSISPPQGFFLLLSGTGVFLLISGLFTWNRFWKTLREPSDG